MKRANPFNNIHILTTLSIVLMIIFGCSSDEQNEEFVYPSSLILSAYEVTSDVKVYTQGGEITDSKAISNFLKNNINNSTILFESKGIVELNNTGDSISYVSKDFALLKDKKSRFNKAYGDRILKTVGGMIYFYPKDTLIEQFDPYGGNFRDIISQIGEYKPYFKQVIPPFPYYKSFEALVAKGNPTKLEFPYLNFYFSRKNNNERGWQSSRLMINNTFDKNVISFLKLGDTLAIQEAKKIYKKY